MPYTDWQTFINDLEKDGHIKRITAEVDPVLEIAEITDRMCKAKAAGDGTIPVTDPVHGGKGGYGLIFENVKGSDIPVAVNIFGSYERTRRAFGVSDFEDLANRVQELVKPEVPTTLMDKLKKLPQLAKLATYGPKVGKKGRCQEVVITDNPDLTKLPILQCWPHDGKPGYGLKPADYTEGTGRYITFAGIYTKEPDTGLRNVGMYRVQVFGPKKCAMHWHMHHDGAKHFRKYKERGEKTPLAIVLGGEPVLTYAATCPLPPDVSELLFAGFLNNGGVELVPCKTIPMEVPVHLSPGKIPGIRTETVGARQPDASRCRHEGAADGFVNAAENVLRIVRLSA